jgi:hypothetical protein
MEPDSQLNGGGVVGIWSKPTGDLKHFRQVFEVVVIAIRGGISSYESVEYRFGVHWWNSVSLEEPYTVLLRDQSHGLIPCGRCFN